MPDSGSVRRFPEKVENRLGHDVDVGKFDWDGLCVQTWDLLFTRNTGIKGVLLFHIVPCLFLGAGSSRSRARKKEQ